MEKCYEVEVAVHGATPPRGKPVKAVSFIIKACCPQVARSIAMDHARAEKVRHPRTYKNATFSVADEKIRLFWEE